MKDIFKKSPEKLGSLDENDPEGGDDDDEKDPEEEGDGEENGLVCKMKKLDVEKE